MTKIDKPPKVLLVLGNTYTIKEVETKMEDMKGTMMFFSGESRKTTNMYLYKGHVQLRELTEEEKEIEKELLKSKQKKVETISHTYFEPFERYKK